MQDAVVTAVCKEKSAEELRNFTPWISWVNTIEVADSEGGHTNLRRYSAATPRLITKAASVS